MLAFCKQVLLKPASWAFGHKACRSLHSNRTVQLSVEAYATLIGQLNKAVNLEVFN